MAVSAGAAGLQVALPAAFSWSVARFGRHGLGDSESDRNSFAGISGQGGQIPSTCRHRGDWVHVVAADYGRQAASAGCSSVIGYGCIAALPVLCPYRTGRSLPVRTITDCVDHDGNTIWLVSRTQLLTLLSTCTPSD